MKILYLPLNAGGNIQAAMYRAFEELDFVEFKAFDYYVNFEKCRNVDVVNQQFFEVAQAFQPDFIHMQLQMTGVISPNTVMRVRKAIGKKVIITNWTGDVRDEIQRHVVEISPTVDYTLISSTGQKKVFEKAGCSNVRYWQIGYDETIFKPLYYQNFDYDLIFAGNAYSIFQDAQKRVGIINILKQRLGNRFMVCGTGYPSNVGTTQAYGSQLNEMYNKSRCIFAMSNYNDIETYFSDRTLTCLGTGRPTIHWRFPGSETYFSDKQDYFAVDTVQDVHSLVDFCRDNPEVANEVGLNGLRKARAEHTYKVKVIELLHLVGLL